MVQLTFMPIKQSRTNYLIRLISFSLIRHLNINLYAGMHLKSFQLCKLPVLSTNSLCTNFTAVHFIIEVSLGRINKYLKCIEDRFVFHFGDGPTFPLVPLVGRPSTSEDMVRKQIFRQAKHEHAGILCVHFNMTLAFRSSKEAISVPLRTLTGNRLDEMGREL